MNKVRLITLLALALASLGSFLALWLDLTQQGLAWQVLWNVTGETEPAAQLLGGAQYAANLTRAPLHTADSVPVQHIPENPFGVNTFLQLEVFPEKRERQLRLVQEAGFGWLRQEFPWEDIEIHGRGDFMDRRNLEAVGEISAWDKYDNIVDLTEAYNLQMIVRLSSPPTWSQPPNWTADGPPTDLQDFVNFAVAVAERYKGRLRYYQIWNEPNLYPEWGEQSINPAGYAELLCRTHDALKAVDPHIVILSAAIGPTVDLSGRDAYDLLYLQRLYDFGFGRCFDILSAQGYGLFSGPTDRRMRQTTMNFGRVRWLRDLMVANGDAHKPIWMSEAGWNPVPTAAEVPDIYGRETYGMVTMEQAAAWVPLAYQRALSEWDWLGTISYWYLKRPDDSEKGLSWYYFRLVEHDFTPTPIYDSFKRTIQSGEWRGWRAEKANWETQARARLPQVLGGGLALFMGLYVLGHAVLERLWGAR